ncbi:MAG: hypothetical protein GY724_15175, partial [Actinomycetia bacterium]|nr:hypothetical protein [Actinomycetes bacterium]
MTKPFRWDLSKREQLGALVGQQRVDQAPAADLDAWRHGVEFATCAARVLAFSQNSDLVFVGRSPESLFDYLSGILADATWHDRLYLLNISMRGYSAGGTSTEAEAKRAGREHFRLLGLDPEALLAAPRPKALVDLVDSGSTLGRVADFVLSWAGEIGVDVPAIRSKLRFVGITVRTKTSPNTWRWQQNAAWMSQFPASVARNVSIPRDLWSYLGNSQPKVVSSNPAWRWADPEIESPPRQTEHLNALRSALYLYEKGCEAEERRRFHSHVAREPPVNQAWYRGLIHELRST